MTQIKMFEETLGLANDWLMAKANKITVVSVQVTEYVDFRGFTRSRIWITYNQKEEAK